MPAAPSLSPARYATATEPLHLDRGGVQLVVLIDGTACWSNGSEAAEALRCALSSTLGEPRAAIPTMDALAPILSACAAEVVAEVPPDPADWGWSVSLAVLRVEGAELSTAAVGALTVLCLDGDDGARVLHRPGRLVDRLVAEGRLSAEEAAGSSLRKILEGPFLSPEYTRVVSGPGVRLRAGDRIVVGGDDLVDHVGALGEVLAGGDARAVRDAVEALGGRSAPTVVWGPLG